MRVFGFMNRLVAIMACVTAACSPQAVEPHADASLADAHVPLDGPDAAPDAWACSLPRHPGYGPPATLLPVVLYDVPVPTQPNGGNFDPAVASLHAAGDAVVFFTRYEVVTASLAGDMFAFHPFPAPVDGWSQFVTSVQGAAGYGTVYLVDGTGWYFCPVEADGSSAFERCGGVALGASTPQPGWADGLYTVIIADRASDAVRLHSFDQAGVPAGEAMTPVEPGLRPLTNLAVSDTDWVIGTYGPRSGGCSTIWFDTFDRVDLGGWARMPLGPPDYQEARLPAIASSGSRVAVVAPLMCVRGDGPCDGAPGSEKLAHLLWMFEGGVPVLEGELIHLPPVSRVGALWDGTRFLVVTVGGGEITIHPVTVDGIVLGSGTLPLDYTEPGHDLVMGEGLGVGMAAVAPGDYVVGYGVNYDGFETRLARFQLIGL